MKLVSYTDFVKAADAQEESPSKVPLLAGLGAAAVSAPLLYSAIRRPTYSSNKALAAMQRASKGNFARAVTHEAPTSKLRQYFEKALYDADELHYWPKGGRIPKKVKKFDGLVYHPQNDTADWVKGTTNAGLTPQRSVPLMDRIGDDKWKEYQFFNKHAPGAMAKTENLANVLGKKKIPRGRVQSREALDGLQERLSGPKGFVMKDTAGVQSSGKFPTEEDDLATLYSDYKKRGLDKKIQKLTNEDTAIAGGSARLKELKKDPAFSGRILDQAVKDPSKVIVQQKMNIAKPGPLRGLVSGALGNPRSKEMRVHVINGQAVHDLTVPRFDPTSLAFDRDLMRGASDHAQKIVDKLPKQHRGMNFAMDIAPLEGGGYKMVESNPSSNSGLLDPYLNPLMGAKMRKAMTGQWSKNVAGAGALAGSAALGAGAYGVAKASEE